MLSTYLLSFTLVCLQMHLLCAVMIFNECVCLSVFQVLISMSRLILILAIFIYQPRSLSASYCMPNLIKKKKGIEPEI